MAFTLDTTLGTLLDDPQAKAVIDQYLPGVSANPMIAMARGFTLTMLLSMPQAAQFGLTKEKVELVLAEINKQIK
jgi:para-nitrobenzyl esterase